MKFKAFLQTKGIGDDAFSKMEPQDHAKLHTEYLDELSKAVEEAATSKDIEELRKEINEAADKGATPDQVKGLTDALEAMKQTVEAQGVRIVELGKTSEKAGRKTLEQIFKAKYDEIAEEKDYGQGKEFRTPHKDPITIEMKEIVSTDIMSVNNVSAEDFPEDGTTGIVNSTMRTLYARVVGFFRPKRTVSRIMEFVDVQPLTESVQIVINETITGTAEVTPECELKPVIKMTFTPQEASAEAVAGMWFTTTKLRRFFATLINRIEKTIAELVNEKIPDYVLTAVRAGANAFTPNAALAINDNPNNYDAIGAVIASMENMNWQPNVVMVNPIAWRNMKQDKTADGIYTLSNGQSIAILQDRIDWGGFMVQVLKDPALAIDEFIIGDMSTVKVAVDSQLMYFETDGRTDVQADSAVTGLSRNIRTHVIEKFVSVIIPDATSDAIIRDTFSNVKTLITAEPTT